jgi:hypothetical protein
VSYQLLSLLRVVLLPKLLGCRSAERVLDATLAAVDSDGDVGGISSSGAKMMLTSSVSHSSMQLSGGAITGRPEQELN